MDIADERMVETDNERLFYANIEVYAQHRRTDKECDEPSIPSWTEFS